MKRVLLVVVVVALIGLGGWLGLRWYLKSGRVVAQVASRLEAIYGGPVQVKEVDVGLTGSSLSGVELFEEGATENEPAWLHIDHLWIDVSLWDAIRGEAAPKQAKIDGATVQLRFSRNGDLLTRFPAKIVAAEGEEHEPIKTADIPAAEIEKVKVVLRKEGHADLVADNLTASVKHDGENAILSGSADNAEVGKLLLDASFDGAKQRVTAHLKTERSAHVGQPLLERVPFVPAVVWEEVHIKSADSTAELNVSYDLASRRLGYRLALDAHGAIASVPSARLPARNASARINVIDNLVEIREAQGEAFGGTIRGDADLDFRGAVTRLNFPKVVIKGMKVTELPAEWHIPAYARALAGKLDGTAKMEVAVHPAQPSPVAAESLLTAAGLSTGFAEWLPSVALLATFPRATVEYHGEGKGTVVGPPGSDESGSFEWRIGNKPRKAAEPPKTGLAPRDAEQFLLALAATQGTFFQPPARGAYPDINVKFGRAVDAVLGDVQTTLQGVADVGGGIFARLQKKSDKAPGKAELEPTYIDLSLKLNKIDLAEFVKSVNVKVPFPVAGKLSFQVKASIPVDNPGDMKLYKATGTAQVTQLTVADVKIDEASADLKYANGVLDLQSLKGRFAPDPTVKAGAPSGFQGSGRLEVEPLGVLTANLTLDRIPLGQVASIAGENVPLAGTFSGKLNARVAVAKLNDPVAWIAGGTITSDRLGAYGMALEDASATIDLKDGVLNLPALKGKLEGTPVSATANLRLTGDYPFNAHLDLRNWDLASLMKASAPDKKPPIALAGAFTTTADLKGTLKPFAFDVAGDAATGELHVNALTVSDARFHWQSDGDRLMVKDIVVHLYGGEASGSATLPLKPKAAGDLDLAVRSLDAKQLTRALAVPFKVDGQVDGQVKGKLAPAPDGKDRTASFNLSIKAPKLRVQNIPTEQLTGKVEYQAGTVDYKLEGKTLGGTFDLEGKIPSKAQPVKEGKGHLHVRGIDLARLVQALNIKNVPLSGILNVELSFSQDNPDQMPEGTGALRVTSLRWHNDLVASELRGALDLTAGQLRLRELSGTIARGTFRGQAAINLRQFERSWINLALDDVDAGRLLAPWFDDKVEGQMQVRVRGTLGAEWRGTADVEFTRGKVYGVEISGWRIPATWHFAPAQDRGQVVVTDSSAQVARGRATGKVTLSWDYAARVEGQVRFSGVDVHALIRPFAGETQVVGGQMTGHFDFSGSEVRSINDVNGLLEAKFTQTQALQVPVLKQVSPLLGVGSQTTFQRGDLRARLDRGVLRVQRLALEGGSVDLFADGTINLEGRLNLTVVARTGNVGLPTARLRLLGLRVPIAGPVPVAVLLEASNLLSNRVLYLTVAGSVRSPVVRVEPLPTLTEGAVRFFLGKSNVPVFPSQ